MIYTVGNSHAHMFTRTHYGHQGWGRDTPHFRSFSIRPCIAKTFWETHAFAIQRVLKKYTKDDFILIAIGERDCSHYIPKDCVEFQKTHGDLIKQYVDIFFVGLLALAKTGVNFIGWSGHPTGDIDSINLKNHITREWDLYIGNKYRYEGFKHVSVVNDLMNEDGTLNTKFFFTPNDGIHLNYDAMAPIVEARFGEQGFEVKM